MDADGFQLKWAPNFDEMLFRRHAIYKRGRRFSPADGALRKGSHAGQTEVGQSFAHVRLGDAQFDAALFEPLGKGLQLARIRVRVHSDDVKAAQLDHSGGRVLLVASAHSVAAAPAAAVMVRLKVVRMMMVRMVAVRMMMAHAGHGRMAVVNPRQARSGRQLSRVMMVGRMSRCGHHGVAGHGVAIHSVKVSGVMLAASAAGRSAELIEVLLLLLLLLLDVGIHPVVLLLLLLMVRRDAADGRAAGRERFHHFHGIQRWMNHLAMAIEQEF